MATTRVVIAGYWGEYGPGDTAEVDSDEARSLITRGLATEAPAKGKASTTKAEEAGK